MKLTDSEFQEKVTAIMAAPERQETEKQNEGEGRREVYYQIFEL